MLEPVGGVSEGVEFGGVAVAEAVVGHGGEEESVAFAPEDACGDVNLRVGEFVAVAKCGAIPIHHGSEGAGLRPGGAILSEIVGGECAGTAGTDYRAFAETEVECGEDRFREHGELEKKHVPTAADLAKVGSEVTKHDAGVRDVEDGEFGDALRVEEGGAPSDGGAPVVAGEEEFFSVELIGDGEDVGNQMGHRVVGGTAGLAAGVVAALIGDDDTQAGVGERGDLFVPGVPEFWEAMEEDCEGGVGRSGGDRMNFD